MIRMFTQLNSVIGHKVWVAWTAVEVWFPPPELLFVYKMNDVCLREQMQVFVGEKR